jgi:hypothetical protein
MDYWLQYYAKGAEAPGVGEKLLISASAAGMLAGMCTMPAAYRSWLPLISTVANLYSRMPQVTSAPRPTPWWPLRSGALHLCAPGSEPRAPVACVMCLPPLDTR